MVQKIKQFHALTSVLLMLALLAFPRQVFAEENKCMITLPADVEVSDASAPSDTEFEVILKSLDAETPMPKAGSGTVKGSGRIVLGPIEYTVPGDYHYSISQKVGNAANYTYDTAVYMVTVRVVNDENGGLTAEVWAVKDGGTDKVEEIVFSNGYKAPEKPKAPEDPVKPAAPQTGDTMNVHLLIAILAISAMVLVIIGVRQSREERHLD